MKNIRVFYVKIVLFLVVEFSIYLNRRVFVMSMMNNRRVRAIRNLPVTAICKRYAHGFSVTIKSFLHMVDPRYDSICYHLNELAVVKILQRCRTT